MARRRSQDSRTRRDRPMSSAPTTIASGQEGWGATWMLAVACWSSPMIHLARRIHQRSYPLMISKPETVDGVPLDLLGGEPGSRGRVHDAAQAFSPMRASSQQHAPGSARADGLHDRTTATHRERIG